MQEQFNAPLDFEEKEVVVEEVPKANKLMFVLEMVPISLIGLGVFLRHQGIANWQYLLIFGGGIAAFIYIFFSWYMFKVKKYQMMEVCLSVFTGLLFGIGTVGVIFRLMTWQGSESMIYGAFTGGIGLTALCIMLFVIHLNDERGAAFYRNLLARLLIMSSILLSIYIN